MDTTETPRRSARSEPRLTWHQRHHSSLTRGERAADAMRNKMGSWGFVGGFVAFMVVWAAVNTAGGRWDPYPFILLNLFLSMLAGLQGAILLIAAKRQDGIAAALAQHDFDTNAAAKVDIEALLEINHRQLLMLADLQAILGRTVLEPERAPFPQPDVVPLGAARRAGSGS
ncbi:DUF1003 domain-containing protein [Curtobacterium sp. VKM Ac-1393]|uniref:DUF1003 domain-containing protein n=1 Tax=Curtobacterium sp. VKM Ac-1393 TaxID=2783814 RepID=UPI002B27A682|nr:DUF1003 domain-containing protein [Curtobacterium sp. VKM Ac-1393]